MSPTDGLLDCFQGFAIAEQSCNKYLYYNYLSAHCSCSLPIFLLDRCFYIKGTLVFRLLPVCINLYFMAPWFEILLEWPS